MIRQITARLGAAVLVLLAAVTVTFVAMYAAPGSTIDLLLGENQDDPQLRAEVTTLWGLDRPLLVQYVAYVSGLFRGDLGTSYALRRPVTQVLGDQLGSTVALTAVAMVAAIALAVAVALATSGRGTAVRRIASGTELVLLSVPSFWIGILSLAVFSFQLRWFPVAGDEGWRSLVLPAASLALPIAGLLTQVLRQGLDRALEEPFAITARARGVSAGAVRRRHGLRHAALPGMTLAGVIVGSLLGGTVIVEQVFGRPGLGRITVDAVYAKDLPVVLGVGLFAAAVFVLVSTVVDLLALAVDPRLRRPRAVRGSRSTGPAKVGPTSAVDLLEGPA